MDGAQQVGFVDDRLRQVDVAQIGVTEVGAAEVGAVEVGAGQVGVLQVAARQVGTRQVGAGEIHGVQHDVAEHRAAGAGDRHVGQIGRASCRERVCQYV